MELAEAEGRTSSNEWRASEGCGLWGQRRFPRPRVRAPSRRWAVLVGGSVLVGCCVGIVAVSVGMPSSTITLAGPVAIYAFHALEKWAEESPHAAAAGGVSEEE